MLPWPAPPPPPPPVVLRAPRMFEAMAPHEAARIAGLFDTLTVLRREGKFSSTEARAMTRAERDDEIESLNRVLAPRDPDGGNDVVAPLPKRDRMRP